MFKRKIRSLQILVIWVYWTTLNIFPCLISKPHIEKQKNHSKKRNGAIKFAQNLWACKKSKFNVWNCKSGRHNRRHTFRGRNLRYKSTSTNILSYTLKVKGYKNRKTNPPSPRRRNQILHANNHCQNTSLEKSIRMEPPSLPFDELTLCNNCIFID